MTWLVVFLAIAVVLGRLCFGHVEPSAVGTYTALAHLFVGVLIGLAIRQGRPLLDNEYLWLVVVLTVLEAVAFFVTRS